MECKVSVTLRLELHVIAIFDDNDGALSLIENHMKSVSVEEPETSTFQGIVYRRVPMVVGLRAAPKRGKTTELIFSLGVEAASSVAGAAVGKAAEKISLNPVASKLAGDAAEKVAKEFLNQSDWGKRFPPVDTSVQSVLGIVSKYQDHLELAAIANLASQKFGDQMPCTINVEPTTVFYIFSRGFAAYYAMTAMGLIGSDEHPYAHTPTTGEVVDDPKIKEEKDALLLAIKDKNENERKAVEAKLRALALKAKTQVGKFVFSQWKSNIRYWGAFDARYSEAKEFVGINFHRLAQKTQHLVSMNDPSITRHNLHGKFEEVVGGHNNLGGPISMQIDGKARLGARRKVNEKTENALAVYWTNYVFSNMNCPLTKGHSLLEGSASQVGQISHQYKLEKARIHSLVKKWRSFPSQELLFAPYGEREKILSLYSDKIREENLEFISSFEESWIWIDNPVKFEVLGNDPAWGTDVYYTWYYLSHYGHLGWHLPSLKFKNLQGVPFQFGDGTSPVTLY